jgi:hypothetical protein
MSYAQRLPVLDRIVLHDFVDRHREIKSGKLAKQKHFLKAIYRVGFAPRVVN